MKLDDDNIEMVENYATALIEYAENGRALLAGLINKGVDIDHESIGSKLWLFSDDLKHKGNALLMHVNDYKLGKEFWNIGNKNKEEE